MRSNLFAKIPAWGRPHTARRISRYTNLFFCKLVQTVLLFCPGWEEGESNFHVFKTIEGGSQVKILDVQAHELCAFGAEDTVPHQF